MVLLLFCIYLFFIHHSISGALIKAIPDEVKTLLCIGDSITDGNGLSDQFYNYPSQLSRLLNLDTSYNGIHYDVINLGASGATVQKNREKSYWNSPQFARASQFSKNASGVVILLGTNDSKVRVWNESLFYTDYSSLMTHFKGFESRPHVYVAIPPPIYGNFADSIYKFNSLIVNHHFPAHLPDFASENGVTVINLFRAMGGKSDGSLDPGSRELFIDDSKPIAWPNDGCHPNNKGYTHLARTIFWELINTRFKTPSWIKMKKGSLASKDRVDTSHQAHPPHQEEDVINKELYSQLLENSFIESTSAAVAKFKLKFRWNSKEEMGETFDHSTIVVSE